MNDIGLDFLGCCLDEIALEGLDGITLSSLWLRLQNRPHFPIALDEKSKEFLWSCFAVHEELSFYELPEPRKSLVIYNRYDHVDLDLGIVIEPQISQQDIYPFSVVDKNGEKGSCKEYHTRKNITAEIKDGFDLKLCLSDVIEKWGEKLVLVASQSARNVALMGTEVNPILEMNGIQYCIMERIGRSRYHGEVSQGKLGLVSLLENGKSFHYYRTTLTRKHLITKQVHYQKSCNGQTASGILLHLTRFYVERRSKMHVMMQRMCEILASKPNNREIFQNLRSQLGMKEAGYKKLFQKAFQQCVKTYLIPYNQMNPNATKFESYTANGKEKLVKVVQLIKPYQEEEEEYDEDEEEVSMAHLELFDPRNFVMNRPLLSQTYKIVEQAGPEGISSQEMGKKLTLPKLDIRLLLRNLEKRGVIMAIMQDVGKQRVTRYITKHLENRSEVCQKFLEESRRILEISLECHSDKKTEQTFKDTDNSGCQNIETEDVIQDIHSVTVTEKADTTVKSDKKRGNGRSFTEDVKYMHSSDRKDVAHITYRMLKRANIIIEAVKNAKLIEGVFKLQRMILEFEKNEGYVQKVDKKSMLRLLNKLAKDGYIKSLKTVLKFGDQEKKLHFLCDPNLSFDDPLIKGAIEQAKFKYFAVSKEQVKRQTFSEKVGKAEKTKSIDQSVSTLRNLYTKTAKQARMEYMPSIGRIYGLEPKFLRMKVLHTFLFYLVYDYQGSEAKITDSNHPPIYHDSKTWKMFVPPLPKHEGVESGWCLISDVLLCMPLSILVKIVNITYKIDGLEEYLSDSVKKHYLIRYIPQHLRNALLYTRRYIFSVHEVATKLSFMGLLSFGPQQLKEKDQVFIYIHRCTKIKNTSISQPGYLHISPEEYSVKDYYLQSVDDVETYWLDLETVCLHTPLGSFNSARGQSIVIVNLFRKPEMIEASKNKQFVEVTDDGFVPGDGLGASGLDSALFSHLKRNWAWPSTSNSLQKRYQKKLPQKQENSQCVGTSYMQYLLQSGEPSARDSYSERRRRLQRLNKSTYLITPSNMKIENENMNQNDNEPHHLVRKKRKHKEKRKPVEDNGVPAPPRKRRKPDIIVRTINRKQWKKRKPYYDDKDKVALKQMSKMRVDWSPQEDSFLLLCKVASCFLNPTFKAMVVPFTVIRDLLCKRCPDLSKNKTSRACQRRLRYMMLNPATVSNVSVFLGEAHQDKALVQQFKKPKPPLSNEKAWAEMFTAVLEKFLTKFTMSASDRCKKITLPNSLKEFQERYQINISGKLASCKSQHTDPCDKLEIYLSVIFSVILASFCTVGDKTNWSYTLYKLYQQYPENLLRSVVARLCSEHLITKRKDLGKRIMKVVPLSSLPYRLSIIFENALQTRYQLSIYCEAQELATKLIDNSVALPGIELDGGIYPGYCAAVISLMALHKLNFDLQIPDQIILFDSSLSAEQCSQFVERVKHLQPLDDGTFSTELAQSLMSERTADTTENEPPAKKICSEQNKLDVECTSNLPAMNIICSESESNDNNNEFMVYSETDHSYCSATSDNGTETEQCIKKENSSSIHIELPVPNKASRIALYMLRQEFTQTPTERAQHAQDFFVINSCRIHCRLNDKLPEKKISCFAYSEEEPQVKNIIWGGTSNKLSDTYFPLPRARIEEIVKSQKEFISSDSLIDVTDNLKIAYDCYSSYVLEEGKKIFSFINDRKELGPTYDEIWHRYNKCKHLKLDSHLLVMIENQVIVRIGVTCFRYVSTANCKPWILSSFIVPKECQALATEIAHEKYKEGTLSSRDTLSQHECTNNSTQSEIQSSSSASTSTYTNNEVSVQSLTLSSENNTVCDQTEASKIVSNVSQQSLLFDSGVNNQQGNKSSEIQLRRKRQKPSGRKTHSVNIESWEQVHFIGRLWRKPDGSLNKPVLQKMMTSVLGYILTYPGTKEQNIIEHFVKVLQPVQILEILDLLEAAVCIRRFSVRSSHKPSLFTDFVQLKIASDKKPGDVVHCEPAVDAIVKMGQFLITLTKR